MPLKRQCGLVYFLLRCQKCVGMLKHVHVGAARERLQLYVRHFEVAICLTTYY